MAERDPLSIVGQLIAEKYQIEKLVGEGGFAVVYRARHTIWKQPVAIKFFNGLSSAPVDQRELFKEQFIQEGALLTELSSQTASIVQARDVGTFTTADGHWMPYMVLEWLDGLPLDEVIERERAAGAPPWTLPQVAVLLGQVASALDVAHGKGIAHRDIKPANLFVLGDKPRSAATVKVLDFGVAKMMTDNTALNAALAKTGTSVTSFTPQYGAPEQFSRSYGATGPWTDVYALALVAAEMLSGKNALDGGDLVQLAFSSGNPNQRPTPRALGAVVPDAVEAVFLKALAVPPRDRYGRAREFWADLEAAMGGMPLSMPGSNAMRSMPASRQSAPSDIGATELAPNIPTLTGSAATTNANAATGGQAQGGKGGVVIGAVLGIAAVAAGVFFLTRGKGSEPTPPAASAAPPAAAAALVPAASSSAAAPTACPSDMVQIPAGQFFMGSDAKDAEPSEKPSHNVGLSSFCIDLYEVTAKKYKDCSDVGKCRRAPTEVDWPGITPADRKLYAPLCTGNDPEKLEHPINCVTWDLADAYCKASDRRLPTEAEWEFATRGPDGRVYPWGDEPPTAAHLNACGSECVAWGKQNKLDLKALYDADDGFATTAPVGKYPAGRSRFGPYDVVGNVWEWVSDWYGTYSTDLTKDPAGPDKGEKKVIRGGAFNGSFASWLHPAFRYAQVPKAQSYGIGFRCAKSIAP